MANPTFFQPAIAHKANPCEAALASLEPVVALTTPGSSVGRAVRTCVTTILNVVAAQQRIGAATGTAATPPVARPG